MTELDSIPVLVEGASGFRTENLRPLMQEIRSALGALNDDGTETTIDLAAMPFTERDEADLRALLGCGEVSATVDAIGPSLVQETAIPGVWLVEHQNVDRRRLTLHLEVTRVPRILMTPREELAEGLNRLASLGQENEE